jgi:hypothetical protein
MSQPFRIKNDFEIAGDLTAESGARFGSSNIPDPDAVAYIQAVEAADGQQLELAVRFALDDFVKGCKSDGIWDAIKASCIMAGARTLGGALVPLRGTAPTNFNFVSGDYNRKTGLKGDASTKYLDSNRADNADPQNSHHVSVYATTLQSSGVFAAYIGSRSLVGTASSSFVGRSGIDPANLVGQSRNGGFPAAAVNLGNTVGLVSVQRTGGTTIQFRGAQTTDSQLQNSVGPNTQNIHVFGRSASDSSFARSDARLSFYSIGEAIDLAALDTRVSALMTALNTAII